MSEFNGRAIRAAFGSFMTGVTVVTARTPSGEYVGFTANSFTSVSLDPPLLAVCPGKHLSSFDVFNQVEHFAISVLAEGQEDISNSFAKATDDRFANVSTYTDHNDTPLIHGACASFSCQVHQRHDAGDHIILVGEVQAFEHAHNHGLGYSHNGYFSLSKERQSEVASSSSRTDIAGVIAEYDDHFLLMNTEAESRLPFVEQATGVGARSALQAYLLSIGSEIELGPVYSVFDDKHNGKRYTYFRAQSPSMDNNGLGTYTPITHISRITWHSEAEKTMLMRFASEHQNQLFGMYLGSDESGEVHTTTLKQE